MKRIFFVFLALLVAVIPLTTGCANQEQPSDNLFLLSDLVDIDNVGYVASIEGYSSYADTLTGEENLKRFFEDCFSDIYFTDDQETVETVSALVWENNRRVSLLTGNANLMISGDGLGILYIGDKKYVTLQSCLLDYDKMCHCSDYEVE